jgi:hypothetical protein
MKETRADSRRWAAKDAGAKPLVGVPNRQAVPARGSSQLGRAAAPRVYKPYSQPAQMKHTDIFSVSAILPTCPGLVGLP